MKKRYSQLFKKICWYLVVLENCNEKVAEEIETVGKTLKNCLCGLI